MVVMMALNMMILAPVMAIGGIIMAVREDALLSLILVVVLPLMAAFLDFVVSRAMPLFKAMQIKIDRINQVTRETLSGVRVIRAFVRDDYEQRRFDVANADLTDTSLKVNRIFAFMIPSLFGILNLSTVAVMWFGSLRVASGAMPIGNLTAFLTYIAMILMSVMMATVMFAMVPRAAASAERIQEVLDTEPTVGDPESPVAPRAGVAGSHRVPRRRVPLPRRRGPRAAQHHLLGRARARSPRSSAGPAAASPRSSTSSRASTT